MAQWRRENTCTVAPLADACARRPQRSTPRGLWRGYDDGPMAILTPVSVDEARVFLLDYADMQEIAAVRGIPQGTVNSSFAVQLATGRRLFLRVYEEQDRAGAVAEARLLVHLAGRGVPTPAPLSRTDGAFVGQVAGKPAALFPWCDGRMRCLASVSPDDARQVGRALAQIHRAGEGYPVRPGRFRPEHLAERIRADCPVSRAVHRFPGGAARPAARGRDAQPGPVAGARAIARRPLPRQRPVGRNGEDSRPSSTSRALALARSAST